MNETEFNIKVFSHKERMYRLSRSLLCDADEAADTVQDVLERLWVRRDDLASYSNLTAFIFTSVRNACLDRLRSRKMREDKRQQVADTYPAYTDPGRLQEIADMKTIAGKIMETLPEKQRMAMHMRDVEGFGMDEIAAIMDIPADSLRVYLSRARKTAREKLLIMMNHGIRQ